MSELFTELTDQQQELVSGGNVDFLEDVDSYYNLDAALTSSTVINGPGGSASQTDSLALDINSEIFKLTDVFT